jgi:hypothetical protein
MVLTYFNVLSHYSPEVDGYLTTMYQSYVERHA